MTKTTILIVDDSETDRIVLKEIFRNQYTIVEASTGQEALELIQLHKDNLAVVLLDLVMPPPTGEDVIDILKANPELSSIPVVVITASNEIESEIALLEAGAEDYIVKPYDPRRVRSRVRNVVQNHELDEIRSKYLLLREQSGAQIQLQAVMDNMPSGVLLLEIRSTAHLLYANRAFYDILQINEEALSVYNHDMLSMSVPEDMEVTRKAIREGIKSKKPFSYRTHVLGKNGNLHTMDAQGQLIPYPESDYPVILVVFSDITKLSSTENSLRDISNQLNTLINNIPGGIAIIEIGDSLTTTYYNDALPQICGYSKDDYESLFLDDVSRVIYALDLPAVSAEIRRGVLEHKTINCAFRLYKKTGGVCWVRMTANQLGCNNGNPLIYCVLIDINREKEKEILSNRATEELKRRVDTDALTGINNLRSFISSTENVLIRNSQTNYVLIRINIEGFRVVNSLFGTQVSDSILKEIASYIQSIVLDVGTYGRVESDHFAICIPKNLLSLEQMMMQINNRLTRLVPYFDVVIRYGLYLVDNINVPVSDMLECARLALHSIRFDVVHFYAYYTKDLRDKHEADLILISQSKEAIDAHEFEVVYRPVFSMDTNRPILFEAMTIWNHPEMGYIDYHRYYPLLEKIGLLYMLDQFVIEQVLIFLHDTSSADLERYPFIMHCSSSSLFSSNFADRLLRLCEKYAISPRRIIISISDSASYANPMLIYSVIDRLHLYGFSIMLYQGDMNHLPLDLLRNKFINYHCMSVPSCVSDVSKERTHAIVRGIITMLASLQCLSCIKDVTTADECAFIQSIHSPLAMGDFFSGAISRDKLLAFIEQSEAESTSEEVVDT